MSGTRWMGLATAAIAAGLGGTGPSASGQEPSYPAPRWSAQAFPTDDAMYPPLPAEPAVLPSPQVSRDFASRYESLPPVPPGAAADVGAPGPGGMLSPYAPGAAMPSTPGAGAGAGALGGPATGTGTAAPGGAGALSAELGGVESGAGGALLMLGDQGPIFHVTQVPGFPQPPGLPPPGPPNQPNPPGLPSPRTRSQLVPSISSFKIAENQSPIPQNRLFFSFNYFNDVNRQLNQFFQAPIQGLQVYRYTWGFEKTFNRGMGSIGLRLPLNVIYARSRPGLVNQGGQFTSLGDLNIFLKHILTYNARTGCLTSVGLGITAPTGPSRFAGAPYLSNLHTTRLQPFLGYYLPFGRLYLHGFTQLDAAVDPSNVTMLYNDIGIGYFLYRSVNPDRLFTAVAPTFETHVNTPLNHRGEYNLFDPAGTPDVVNLTYGVNVEMYRTGIMTFGIVTPVTGPRPYNLEVIALLNIRFGGRRRARSTIVPMVGG